MKLKSPYRPAPWLIDYEATIARRRRETLVIVAKIAALPITFWAVLLGLAYVAKWANDR